MSDRAREFIDHWESENVEAVADPDTAKEAERLASCADKMPFVPGSRNRIWKMRSGAI
jgi:hypothetical protein